MADYIWLWLGKSAAEAILAISVALFVLLIAALIAIRTWIRQARCPHTQVNETRACDAICARCGKNLGFIGVWRRKRTTDGGESCNG